MTIPVPVPALVRASPVALPLLAMVNEVGVERPDGKLNAMLLPEVVVIELPPLYADCKVIVLEEHFVTLLEPSIQRDVPAVPGVVRPFKVKKLEPLVLKTTPLVPFGVNVAAPLALNAWPEATVAPPFNVVSPVTPRVEDNV